MIYLWSLQVTEITVSALSACSSYGLVGGFCFILGLPIQVRDAGLSLKDEMPKSDVNKEYYTQNMEREVGVASHDHAFWVPVCVRGGKGSNDLSSLKTTCLLDSARYCSVLI